jgi:hypothetical protein
MTPLGLFHAPGERIDVSACDGQVLASYHYGADLQRPYLHPLAPPGGPAVTLASPHDHPWHHGAFLSWKFVDGRDLWQGDGGRAVSGPLELTEHCDDRVRWSHMVDWREDEDGSGPRLLVERRDLTVRLVDDTRSLVRWSSTFEVERPIRVHADERGYGGFGIRLIRDLQWGYRLFTADGEVEAHEVRGSRSLWSSWYGLDDVDHGWVGVTLFEDPDNPHAPSPLFVPRVIQQMAYLSSGFTFGRDHTIDPDSPLTLRYGLLLHRGEPADSPGTWQGWFGEDEGDDR